MKNLLFLFSGLITLISFNVYADDNIKCRDLLAQHKYSEALEYCKNTCESKKNDICYLLGSLYIEGQGYPQNPEMAKSFFEKGCEGNNSFSCVELGNLYFEGISVNKDYEKAKFYFEKAVSLKDGLGNAYLGNMYFNGYGVQQDLVLAKQYFKEGCRLDDGTSCYLLSNMLITEADPNLINPSEIKDVLFKACHLEHPESCTTYASLCLVGFFPDVNARDGAIYMLKACDLGDQRACDLIENARKQKE